MSSTPIFDAALADAPRNIWQASNIFPQPVSNPWPEILTQGRFDFLTGAFVPYKVPVTDPTNLGIVA